MPKSPRRRGCGGRGRCCPGLSRGATLWACRWRTPGRAARRGRRRGLAEDLAAIARPVEQLAQRAVLGVLGQDLRSPSARARRQTARCAGPRRRAGERPAMQRVRRVAAARAPAVNCSMTICLLQSRQPSDARRTSRVAPKWPAPMVRIGSSSGARGPRPWQLRELRADERDLRGSAVDDDAAAAASGGSPVSITSCERRLSQRSPLSQAAARHTISEFTPRLRTAATASRSRLCRRARRRYRSRRLALAAAQFAMSAGGGLHVRHGRARRHADLRGRVLARSGARTRRTSTSSSSTRRSRWRDGVGHVEHVPQVRRQVQRLLHLGVRHRRPDKLMLLHACATRTASRTLPGGARARQGADEPVLRPEGPDHWRLRRARQGAGRVVL